MMFHTTKSISRASSVSKPSFFTEVPSPQYPVRFQALPLLWDPPLKLESESRVPE